MAHADSPILIRRFTPDDAAIYKSIRLEALREEPGMFGNSYDTEAAYTDEQWKEGVYSDRIARFGLYDGDQLIGLTGIVIHKDKVNEAYMTQSYIRRPYRGQGLSRLLYTARIAWARQHGISRLVISHRENNYASKAANQHFGFTYTHREQRKWPDGALVDNVFYELVLTVDTLEVHQIPPGDK